MERSHRQEGDGQAFERCAPVLERSRIGEMCGLHRGYDGGKVDCEIPDCPLYSHMPYRKNKETRPKKERTQKQISSDERLALIRSVARRKVGL